MRLHPRKWSVALSLSDGGKIPKATHQHRRHAREQYRTYLKAGDAVYAANTHEHGHNAQKHTDDTAEPADPPK